MALGGVSVRPLMYTWRKRVGVCVFIKSSRLRVAPHLSGNVTAPLTQHTRHSSVTSRARDLFSGQDYSHQRRRCVLCEESEDLSPRILSELRRATVLSERFEIQDGGLSRSFPRFDDHYLDTVSFSLSWGSRGGGGVAVAWVCVGPHSALPARPRSRGADEGPTHLSCHRGKLNLGSGIPFPSRFLLSFVALVYCVSCFVLFLKDALSTVYKLIELIEGYKLKEIFCLYIEI